MATLNSALGIYSAQGGASLGSSSVVYVSIPDPVATSTAGDQCQGLGLPTLPAIYSYFCAASSTYRLVNGTGWIPVNLTTLAGGSPLGQLPIDPINTSSTRDYYTYVTNGTQFEVTSPMESQKYGLAGTNDVVSTDGGTNAYLYEKGTNLALEPIDYYNGDPSLIGYWPLNEGTSTIIYDYSGNNATGSWNGVASGTRGYYSVGKVEPWAGAFDGTDNTITMSSTLFNMVAGNPITVSAWINVTGANTGDGWSDIVGNRVSGSNFTWVFGISPSNQVVLVTNSGPNTARGSIASGTWYNVAATQDGSGLQTIYINGVSQGTSSGNSYQVKTPNGLTFGNFQQSGGNEPLWGSLNDVRVYNRALSATQIAAMYAGGK